MQVLSEAIAQSFYSDLNACIHKSEFDNEFLTNNSLSSLSAYNLHQWLEIFERRLISTRFSEFDWTQIGYPTSIDWTKQRGHANYTWFHLAIHISIELKVHIFKVIFSGVVIAPKDYNYLSKAQHCTSLIYDENFERLQLINRMLILSEKNVYEFANYDQDGEEFPISPIELYQMQRLFQFNFYYEKTIIKDWLDFRTRYIASWSLQATPSNFEDLIYPLFEMVSTYFDEIGNPAEMRGETQKLLGHFYNEHLRSLKPKEVNYFYGQCIQSTQAKVDSLYIWDIFFGLIDSKNSLLSILPQMVKLAVWITHQNPAMLIDYQDVDEEYCKHRIGPYLNREKLGREFLKLLRCKNEIPDDELEEISHIAAQLLLQDGTDVDDSWAETELEAELTLEILELFRLREEYNQRETHIDVTKSKILKCPHEYVYYRAGANAIYINIARLLEAAGSLRRVGIEDYFLALMPDLASPIDNYSHQRLSKYPFSHYARPKKDRTYLINLNNSVESFEMNRQCFYDVNSLSPANFLSPEVYLLVQNYSAERFRKYPRIPSHENYRLKISTIIAIANLVNNSFNYEATIEGEAYTVREGLQNWGSLQEKVIEYSVNEMDLTYQVRDSWNMERVHFGYIPFENIAERRSFIKSNDKERLKFILDIAITKGHARSNLIIEKYFRTYEAYETFRQIYNNLPYDEQQRLNKVTMYYAGTARTFLEIWAGGFPECMSTASKWFSNIPLKYFPKLKYKTEIENDALMHGNDCLNNSRKSSPGMSWQFVEQYVENDMPSMYSLIEFWSTSIRIVDRNERAHFGIEQADLISVTDSPGIPTVRQLSVFKPVNGKIRHVVDYSSEEKHTDSEADSIVDDASYLGAGRSGSNCSEQSTVSGLSIFSRTDSPTIEDDLLENSERNSENSETTVVGLSMFPPSSPVEKFLPNSNATLSSSILLEII